MGMRGVLTQTFLARKTGYLAQLLQQSRSGKQTKVFTVTTDRTTAVGMKT
jgi:hypothetical protein